MKSASSGSPSSWLVGWLVSWLASQYDLFMISVQNRGDTQSKEKRTKDPIRAEGMDRGRDCTVNTYRLHVSVRDDQRRVCHGRVRCVP